MNRYSHKLSGQSTFPPQFLDLMSQLLGDEYPAFIASLLKSPITGLRVNSLKLSPKEFNNLSPFLLAPVAWCPTGYSLDTENENLIENQPGKHIFHTVGMYYLQEPSAMVAAELLAPKPGEKVLDIAAAPGGKTTHLAALMNNTGLLVANEIHPRRVWDLAENLERLGVTNAIVLNETPQNLAHEFGEYFDKILLDAPCSGEGMFRKSETARKEWRPDLSKSCAYRQQTILEQAAQMLKPGGHLLYTTCTFSPLENESVIAQFLDKHEDFQIESVSTLPGLESAKPEWIDLPLVHKIRNAVRIWPHHANGEGHFAALMTKKGKSTLRQRENTRNNRDLTRKYKLYQDRKAHALFSDFFQDNLSFTFDEERTILEGSYVYLQPPGSPGLRNLKVIHPGFWLGSIQGERFKPSHALAMGINQAQAKITLQLELGDNRISHYMAGESIIADGENGWVLITVGGFPLSWGKRVNQVVKNYYPKGLRI